MHDLDVAFVRHLADRVAILEAERAIIDRLCAYGHTIDAGDEAGWIDCFTVDGRFFVESPEADRPPIDIKGRAALAEFIRHHTRRPGVFHQHGMVEPRVKLSDDRRSATCQSYLYSLMRHPELKPVMRVFGRYSDELVCDGDGAWRFRSRKAIIDAATPGLPPVAFAHLV